MCNYSAVPVSKFNSFPSATTAWRRISFFAASYGGEFNETFFNAIMAYEQRCAPAIAQLQAAGVQFTARKCFHWAVELCGSFEVTHRQYKQPAGSELPYATPLYCALAELQYS